MNSKLLLFGAAILAIVCAWLPWVSFMGISVSGFQGEMKGNAGLVIVILGALIGLMAFLGKKWSAIVAIVLSLCVGGLGVHYYMDAHQEGMNMAGYGLYVMIAAGVLGVIGGIMAMKGPGKAATTA